MKCPACSKEMVTENFGLNVDVCEAGCKSIWFDQGELQNLDEKNEGLGAALEAALRQPTDNKGERGKLHCPKCSIPLHTHKYQRAKEVNVDECYKCGGFFLDSGELTTIRDNYMSDDELKVYIDQLINSIPEFSNAVKDLDARKRRLDSIQHLTRFMTLNYWRKKF